MPSVIRWIFFDPATATSETVPQNPDAMTSPYPTRKYVYNSTTAGAAGVVVANEAKPDPEQWQFSGTCRTRPHFELLLRWSRKRNRVTITDHYKRQLVVSIDKFEHTPKRSGRQTGTYWLCTYTVSCSVYAVTDSPSTGVPD